MGDGSGTSTVFEGHGILSIDGDRCIDANAAASGLFGIDPDALAGRRVEEVLPDIDVETLRNGAPGTREETTLGGGGDTTRTFEVALTTAPSEGSEMLVIRPHDRRNYDRLLDDLTERFEWYSSTVNHDLRTPLSVATGWIEVAIETDSTDRLSNIEESLDRLEAMVTDLGEIGHNGQLVRDPASVDLRRTAIEAWYDADRGDGTLWIDSPLDTISADRGRLLVLFEELFENAVRYGSTDRSDDGVESRGEHSDRSGVSVRIGRLEDGFYLEDDGPGVGGDNREAVFEYGYTTSENRRGRGLALVEAIAEAHRWEPTLLADDDAGARFEFCKRWHPDRD